MQYDFTLRLIRLYFGDMYDRYRRMNMNEELRVPGIGRIDNICQLTRNGAEFEFFGAEYNQKKVNHLQVFANVDLEDCIIPENPADVD